MTSSTTHIYLNPIRSDRVEDFERFLEVVRVAVDAQRPDLRDRWQVLRAAGPGDKDSGVTTYAFIFDGGDRDADWELNVLMPAQYGQEEAERLMSEAAGTYATFQDWVASLGAHDQEHPQIGWTFEAHPKPLDP